MIWKKSYFMLILSETIEYSIELMEIGIGLNLDKNNI